ncbi:hypothetical protein LJK87_49670 [Paenibacillus sp. P25]|nr:hypothetical protein LJK87_49670 [Paenibacillus sp. P25]
MKLVTFIENGGQQLGVKTDRGIVHIVKALEAFPSKQTVASNVHEVIEGGQAAVAALQAFVDEALSSGGGDAYILDEAKLTFAPCVPSPNKIICVGLNYRKHAEETNAPIPQYPILFNKFNNTLTGHGHDVPVAGEGFEQSGL